MYFWNSFWGIFRFSHKIPFVIFTACFLVFLLELLPEDHPGVLAGIFSEFFLRFLQHFFCRISPKVYPGIATGTSLRILPICCRGISLRFSHGTPPECFSVILSDISSGILPEFLLGIFLSFLLELLSGFLQKLLQCFFQSPSFWSCSCYFFKKFSCAFS